MQPKCEKMAKNYPSHAGARLAECQVAGVEKIKRSYVTQTHWGHRDIRIPAMHGHNHHRGSLRLKYCTINCNAEERCNLMLSNEHKIPQY